MTVGGRTEAHLYGPGDCSTHVRSRWLFGSTTSISPRHVEPFHLRVCLQRRRFASNARLNPLAEAPAARYFNLYPSHHIVFPFNEPRLELAAAWSRNRRAGGLEKHEGVEGSIRSFHSVSGRDNGGYRHLGAA
ncbi:uncharacterized protein BDR25DRAFT_30951 [Lindgomyces ingoldianus]|uniref:Uncharacterized protein n=1 Tax=Lindgomyces ingoldianus TaxID=673940 RepID=A0ACB6QWJ4_9PLEO|nr:uncharacterized protein BDR25DRAFT_30951 [Lindgomyces ingoldianus]KAF2470571.1 hypothetical protein BDR25DRAFT_30951 [Lindgomyces ingoldianus]